MLVCQHIVQGHISGHVYNMTWHTVSDVGNPTDAQAAFVTFLSNLFTGGAGPAGGIASLVQVSAAPTTAITYEISLPTFEKVVKLSNSVSITCSGSATRLPVDVVACVIHRSAQLSDVGRSRVYLPPMDTATLSGSQIAAATVTRIIGSFAYALSQWRATTYLPAVLSRRLVEPQEIIAVDMANTYFVLRSRARGYDVVRTRQAVV